MALRLRKDKQSLSQTNGFSQPLTPSFFLLCYTVSTKTAKEAAKMLRKYDTIQDAQSHLPAALPSSEMVVHITGRSFMQRLSDYLCRHELEFWVFQLLLVPLLVLLVLVATVYKGNIIKINNGLPMYQDCL